MGETGIKCCEKEAQKSERYLREILFLTFQQIQAMSQLDEWIYCDVRHNDRNMVDQ
jgi:hypothetical protein